MSPYSEEAFKGLRISFEHERNSLVKQNWDHARQIDTIAAYDEFLSNNPSSPFIADARRRLEIIGKDPIVEATWASNRANIDKARQKHRGENIQAFILFPIISDGVATRLVYKDRGQMYQEIRSNDPNATELPRDFELLKLRYSAPYEAVVLFISHESSKNKKVFENEFNSVTGTFHWELRSAFKYDDYKHTSIHLLPNRPLLESHGAANFYENVLLLAAQSGVDFNAVLHAQEPKTIGETGAVKRLIRDLRAYLFGVEGKSKIAAIDFLLYINVRDGFDAIVSVGKGAIGSLIELLGDKDKDIRERAAVTLADIGEPSVLPLIAELQNPKRNQLAIWSLGKIGDLRAIPPLVELLMEWNVGPRAASALNSLSWRPVSTKEQTYLAVAKRDMFALSLGWNHTREILLAEVASPSQEKIKGAVYSFIAIGKTEVIPQLVRALDAKGNKIMAETYLNSGNSSLRDAAKTWAYRHGYRIIGGSGASEVTWGKF